MRKLVNKYIREGKNIHDPAVARQLNMDFARTATDAAEAVLATQNVTLSQFESSIKAHTANLAVIRSLEMFQMKQQKELVALAAKPRDD